MPPQRWSIVHLRITPEKSAQIWQEDACAELRVLPVMLTSVNYLFLMPHHLSLSIC